MVFYLFPLLKSCKLEIRFINIQPDTLTFTDLILVNQILRNFRSCFKVLEHGILYRIRNFLEMNFKRLGGTQRQFSVKYLLGEAKIA